MPVFKRPDAELHYEVHGSGFPLLLFAPGGLSSQLEYWRHSPSNPSAPPPWMNPMADLAGRFTVVGMDQRNAGNSRGRVTETHGWHTYAGDHLALMDHLGFRQFHVMGGCIGGTYCLTLCELAPERITAAVLQNPIGLHDNHDTWEQAVSGFAKTMLARDPSLTEDIIRKFGHNMFGGDFVFSVSREFVRRCPTPLLLQPGTDKPHPAATSDEIASLAPNLEIQKDWRGPTHLAESIRRVTDFLTREHAQVMNDALTGQTVELLQQLIRNSCVNDGSVASGQEVKTSDVLKTYLQGSGLDIEVYQPDHAPGRTSLVARIEGTDPAAPTLCLMGHTDVVPVNPATWTRDPFGGELVKGEVWGRGALDMLNITASQAVVLKTLAKRGWRPRGTLVYLACADEEAGGALGAGHVCKKHWDSLRADYLLTENGGTVSEHDGQTNVVVHVGEKGVAWRRLRVKGTPGHGSMPYGADNALIKAAQVVTRLADYHPSPYVSDLWHTFVGTLDVAPAVKEALVDPSRVDETIAHLAPGLAKYAYSATHTTFSPNMCRAGVKTNVIPDTVDIEVDIRTIPGDNEDEVLRHLDKALGPIFEDVEIEKLFSKQASVSPTGTPLWDVLGKVVDAHYPGAKLLPRLIVGFTDAPYFREHGATAYGFGLFSRTLTYEAMSGRFHGNDERIDVESLALTTQAWLETCELFLG